MRAQSRAGKRGTPEIRDLREALDRMRLLKDAHEANNMRRAAAIASAGHARAMRACRPGMAEYALEAELGYEFRKHGADSHAYSPIVAGGRGMCPAPHREQQTARGEQAKVLIDAGCESRWICLRRIPRTFPVNSRSSAVRRDANGNSHAPRGAASVQTEPLHTPTTGALRVLVQKMIDLKLRTPSNLDPTHRRTYKPFYMHRTGALAGARRSRRRRLQNHRRQCGQHSGTRAFSIDHQKDSHISPAPSCH
ncbi:MAG: M24 family metallopeptidase [Propionivibrio sp.]|nr:M24 family metallopeptidase [Propionivibrio sp.]